MKKIKSIKCADCGSPAVFVLAVGDEDSGLTTTIDSSGKTADYFAEPVGTPASVVLSLHHLEFVDGECQHCEDYAKIVVEFQDGKKLHDEAAWKYFIS